MVCQPHGLLLLRLLCSWGFSRQEYWSGLPWPPPGGLPNLGVKPRLPTLQVDSLPAELSRKPLFRWYRWPNSSYDYKVKWIINCNVFYPKDFISNTNKPIHKFPFHFFFYVSFPSLLKWLLTIKGCQKWENRKWNDCGIRQYMPSRLPWELASRENSQA